MIIKHILSSYFSNVGLNQDPNTPAAIPWAHGRQEENQKWFSQPNSPACNLTDEEISLPRSVGRFLYELQSSYGEPEARRKEIVNSRGDTNAEGVKEQHVLQSSLVDSSVGSKETRRFKWLKQLPKNCKVTFLGNVVREEFNRGKEFHPQQYLETMFAKKLRQMIQFGNQDTASSQ